MHLPCGVAFGDVEGGEVVEIILNLGAFSDDEAKIRKNSDEFFRRLRDGVDCSTHSGEGDIYNFFG